MGLLIAWRFLTIVPLPGATPVSAKELGASQGFFPLVGLLLGGGLAALDWLLGLIFPLSLASALTIAAWVAVTGALHLDGLVDTCDGLAPGRTREERLAIMRDSHSGGFGVAGGVCLLLAKYGALLGLVGPPRFWSLLLAPTLGRWALVHAILAYPYAHSQGKGSAFKAEASLGRFLLATFWAALPSLALLRLGGLALLVGNALVGGATARFLASHFGGLTGDSYGAINEVVEVTSLALLPLVLWLREVPLG